MVEKSDSLNTPSNLPSKPASFECHYAGANWKRTIDCPAKMPRSAKYVAAVEWSWSPYHNRQDKYHLSMNRSRTYWILWNGYYDDFDTGKYVHFPYAYGPRQPALPKIAALYLLLEGWRGENKEHKGLIDQHYSVVSSGLLSAEELDLVAELVWPEYRIERLKAAELNRVEAEEREELNKTGYRDYPYFMAYNTYSSNSFIRQGLEEARQDKAPRNAVYKDKEGKWHVLDEVKDEEFKARIDLRVKSHVGENQKD